MHLLSDKLYSEDVCQSLINQVDAIAQLTLQNKNVINQGGLLCGKAGVTLLIAYLVKIYPYKTYPHILEDYLDELNQTLANDQLDYSMSAGVAGIAFVFQHLRNIGMLDTSDDLNLSELDEFICSGAEQDFQTGNWDPLHGMVGLGIYFLERNKETGEKKYLEKIVDHLAGMRTAAGVHRVWVTRGFGKFGYDDYNFGMAHGMPGILSFLALVYERGIRQHEIEEMISSSIPFLLKNEYMDEAYCCFPTFIEVNPAKEKQAYSRLAWCYGDLCMANALIHCGKSLQKTEWFDKGVEIAVKTTHRTMENSGCVDAPFCHGTAGLVHQYNRLYQLTKRKVFKDACEKWLVTTLKYFYMPGKYAGGYYYRSFNEKKNSSELTSQYGLLEGSAGIALVFLAYLHDMKPDWDIIFLTNV